MLEKISALCPPLVHDSPALHAAPHSQTSAPRWFSTLNHACHQNSHRPSILLRLLCPSTTSRSMTRASSGSAWSVSATETSTRAYWWGWPCNASFLSLPPAFTTCVSYNWPNASDSFLKNWRSFYLLQITSESLKPFCCLLQGNVLIVKTHHSAWSHFNPPFHPFPPQLTSQDHTPQVICRALEKHNMENFSCQDFSLCQTLDCGKGSVSTE